MKKQTLSMATMLSVILTVSQGTSLTAFGAIDMDVPEGAEVAITEVVDLPERIDFDFTTLLIDTNADITRGKVVEILYGLAGSPAVTETMMYQDVEATASYANAVVWAKEKGIASGYGNSTFAPEQTITRQELSTLLYNYASSMGYGFEGSWMFLLDVNDRESIAGWAYTGACWMNMNQIMLATSEENNFEPMRVVKNEEMSEILTRFTAYLAEQATA